MDGWMSDAEWERWVDGWVYRLSSGWVGEWVSGVFGWMHGRLGCERTDGRTIRKINVRMDWRIDRWPTQSVAHRILPVLPQILTMAFSIVLFQVSVMGELIPHSYFLVEELIQNKKEELKLSKKLPIIHRADFEALVSDTVRRDSDDVEDPNDIKDVTNFLNERGRWISLIP